MIFNEQKYIYLYILYITNIKLFITIYFIKNYEHSKIIFLNNPKIYKININLYKFQIIISKYFPNFKNYLIYLFQ